MAAVPLSTSIPSDLDAELRAAAARTGIPIARLVQQGVRLRLNELGVDAHKIQAGVRRAMSARVDVTPRRDCEVRICRNVDCRANAFPAFHATGQSDDCIVCGQPTSLVGHAAADRERGAACKCERCWRSIPVDPAGPAGQITNRCGDCLRAVERGDVEPATDIASIADDDAFWERLKSGGEVR